LLGGEAPKSNALVNYLLEDYSKSVERAEIYDASSDELIDFEIQYPFLLEKAVFEIPVAAGSTWLGDRTITSLAIGSGTYSSTQTMPNSFYIDSGGPCVTLSLFSQKKYGTKLIRDLVLSGTITSNQDTLSSFIPRNFGARAEGNVPVVMLEPSGIPNPSGIITGTSTFTGSVIIRTRPEISNGVNGVTSGLFIVANLSSLPPLPPELASVAFTVQDFLTHVERLMSKKSVRLKEILGLPVNLLTSEFFTVTSLDAFGRGMTGFSPSGGSIFGGEYTTPQRDLQSEYNRNEFTQNPLYTPDQSVITNTIQQLSSTLDTAYKSVSPASTGAYVQLMYQTNFFGSIKPSPYLINPGDKFILAMSKTRPAISASGHNVPNPAAVDTGFQTLTRQINITGSLSGHDFCLNTGSINITLYGSYVRAGNSYTP